MCRKDTDTKRLLGIGYEKGYPKFMDFEGIASHLYGLPSSPLYDFAKKWSEIDFKALNNSEITTLEEHIKREWGDISAETAGEQYTPFDMIKLAGGLAELMAKRSDDLPIMNIYDMTCGGGNFLFAMEDHSERRLAQYVSDFSWSGVESLSCTPWLPLKHVSVNTPRLNSAIH